MPICSSTRRTGRWDCSTSRMISSFSAAGYLIRRPPHPPSRFFEQTVLQGQIGDHLLERRGLTPQIVDLVRGGGPGCIASQALLSSLQEVLRPAIVQVLRDPLAATQLGNSVLAAQAFQNDPDLLLGRIVLARRPSDVLDNLLSWFLRCSGLLSHLRSCERYDEPETLPYSIHPVCPMSADGGQEPLIRPGRHGGRKRSVNVRKVPNGILARARSGVS